MRCSRTLFQTQFNKLLGDSSGQGLTEYLILLILVAVISIGAVQSLGSTVKKKLQVARENIHRKVDLDEAD